MKAQVPVFTPLLATLAFGVLLAPSLGAQYESRDLKNRLGLPWENGRVRLQQFSVDPGGTLPSAGNQVLIHLTADADGRLPAEAVWRPGGAAAVQNRGKVRLEAIAIELKDVPPGGTGVTPPEALDTQYGLDVTPLIDNAQVFVARHRYDPNTYAEPPHFHPEDIFVVYLRGGYTWPLSGFWGVSRVARGEVEVIPANTFHQIGNAGSDPLELLVIVPR